MRRDEILAIIKSAPHGISGRGVCRILGLSTHGGAVGRHISALLRGGHIERDQFGKLRACDFKQPAARRDQQPRRVHLEHIPEDEPPTRSRCHTLPGFSGRVLVAPDVHAPYHDRRAWGAFVNAARILRPAAVVVIGDFIDSYSVSSHSRDPKRRANIAWEVDQAAELLRELTDATPAAFRWYLEGNHEHRLPRYIADRAPELDGFVPSLAERLQLDRMGWQWIDSQEYLKLGRMSFAHGWRCGKYALPQTVSEWGGCITVGHTHRLGVWYSGDVRGDDHVGLNVGWLGDVESIDYRYRATAERDWQHGMGVVEIDDDGIAFAHAVPIINGRTKVGSRTVTA